MHGVLIVIVCTVVIVNASLKCYVHVKDMKDKKEVFCKDIEGSAETCLKMTTNGISLLRIASFNSSFVFGSLIST